MSWWKNLLKTEGASRNFKQQLKSSESHFSRLHTAACLGFVHTKDWLKSHATTLQQVEVIWKENVRKWHPGQQWITKKNPNSNVCEGILDIVFNPLSLLVALLGPLQFQSSTLDAPSNWETPISGSFVLSVNPSSTKPVRVVGDFAWNYHHDTQDIMDGPDEIWTIDFYSKSSILSLTEGGSQVYMDGQRVTTQRTPEYPLESKYENLYKQWWWLVQDKACAVDDVTTYLLQDIQEKAL